MRAGGKEISYWLIRPVQAFIPDLSAACVILLMLAACGCSGAVVG